MPPRGSVDRLAKDLFALGGGDSEILRNETFEFGGKAAPIGKAEVREALKGARRRGREVQEADEDGQMIG